MYSTIYATTDLQLDDKYPWHQTTLFSESKIFPICQMLKASRTASGATVNGQ